MTAPYSVKIDPSLPTLAVFGKYSVPYQCPHCSHSIMTRVEKDSGLAVWFTAGIICFFGCFCGCCLIPFCIDDMKDAIHYCPNCNGIIGKYSKFQL